MLEELRKKCEAVTARLADIESDLWDAQDGVHAATRALESKKQNAEQVSKRLHDLMRWAENLTEPQDVSLPHEDK